MKVLRITGLIYEAVYGISVAYKFYGGAKFDFYFDNKKVGELKIEIAGEKYVLVTDTPYGYLISELEKGIPIKQHVVTVTDGKPFDILELKA